MRYAADIKIPHLEIVVGFAMIHFAYECRRFATSKRC
jgi:hypothetical protein